MTEPVRQPFAVPEEAPRVIGPWLRQKAAENGSRVAIEIESHQKTYDDIDRDSDRVAAGLTYVLGLELGDHCCLMMVNTMENIDAWLAMCKAGIVEVPINTANRGYLLRYIISQSNATAIVIDEAFVDRLEAIAAQLPNLRYVIVNRETEGDLGMVFPATISVHNLSDLYVDKPPPQPDLSPDDTAVILYTSGTTGTSKGVLLTHEGNLLLARHVVWLMEYGPDDALYTVFPLFHINAKYTSVMASMEAGARLVMGTRFSVSGFWDFVREKQITAFNYQGAMLSMLWNQPDRDDDATNSVRMAFGAPCPVDIWRPFEERFGLHLVEVYGMTEIAIATENRKGETRVGSTGRETSTLHVRIHDENDNEAPPGTPGEVVVRPKMPNAMFKGYHGMEEQTVEAFRNLWFHTGDRGRMDEDGYFYFIDRMKDCIRRRGENISSYEVEQVINTFDDVHESAAYGVESDLTEEEVMIAVVLKPGCHMTPESLLDQCQEQMAHFAVPRYVRFVQELPKTPSQRTQKYKLKGEGITEDSWDREEHGYEIRR
jgi:crotonobetaine/carnitine-CoA ligase